MTNEELNKPNVCNKLLRENFFHFKAKFKEQQKHFVPQANKNKSVVTHLGNSTNI